MLELALTLLCLVGSLVAVGIGVTVAAGQLRWLRRWRAKRQGVLSTMPEGWGVWFFQGFSDMTVGTQFLRTALVLAFWIVLAMSFVGLGFRLAW